MQVQVRIVNAFVDGEQGGNPAGVVLQADALDARQKQAIAAQVGLSETAFVSSSQSAAFKLEFFTPTRQIAHCGRATVATFPCCVSSASSARAGRRAAATRRAAGGAGRRPRTAAARRVAGTGEYRKGLRGRATAG